MSDTNLKLSIFNIDRAYDLNTAAYNQIYLELGQYIGNQIIQASAANYGMAKIDLQEVNNITEQLNQMWIEEMINSDKITEEWSKRDVTDIENEIAILDTEITQQKTNILEIQKETVSNCFEIAESNKSENESNNNSDILTNQLATYIRKQANLIEKYFLQENFLFAINNNMSKWPFKDVVKEYLGEAHMFLTKYSFKSLIIKFPNQFRNNPAKKEAVQKEMQENENSIQYIVNAIENNVKKISSIQNVISIKEKEKNNLIEEKNRPDDFHNTYIYYIYYDIKAKEIEYTTTKEGTQEEIIQWKMELDFIPKGVFLCWTNYAEGNGIVKIKNSFNNIGYTGETIEGKTLDMGDFEGYKKYSFDPLNEKQLEELRNSIDKYKESLEAKV